MVFILNGMRVDAPAQPDETLLWVLREKLKPTGEGVLAALRA